jgi:hypothetical protein
MPHFGDSAISNSETAAATKAAADAENNAGARLRLPDFWPDTPAAWFVFAKSKFRLKNITFETVKFDLLVGSWLDMVEVPHKTTPYTSLKERLLAAHELFDF